MSVIFEKLFKTSDAGVIKQIGRKLFEAVTEAPAHLETVLGHGDSDHRGFEMSADLEHLGAGFGHEFGDLDLELAQSVNRSQEMACALRAAVAQPEGSCPVYWDGILCWPQTAPGTAALLKCFEEFEGIRYDSSREFSFDFSVYSCVSRTSLFQFPSFVMFNATGFGIQTNQFCKQRPLITPLSFSFMEENMSEQRISQFYCCASCPADMSQHIFKEYFCCCNYVL